ncbi:phosphate ABC transporter permease PstA [Aquipuribacter nitratireducens]|uniref:Phosphate transport system permease protein PstA n=1 Tax=Aquipuribacter nitratireducens TaxID=650104 RepID=A0ABW0GM62_9MICO
MSTPRETETQRTGPLDTGSRPGPADTSGLTPERFGAPKPAGPPPPPAGTGLGATSGTLPRRLPQALLLLSAVLSTAVLFLFGAFSFTGAAALTAVVYMLGIYVLARSTEGPRRAKDRVVTALVTVAFVLAMAPLLSLVWTVVSNGIARFDVAFFTETMAGVVGEGGGAAHAIVGTLVVTGIAALISIPVGVLAAVWLVEYGRGPLKAAITFLVDVMTGIPSIVAGLFAVALFITLTDNPGHRSGIAGAMALAVLMTPVVIRSVEEMLKLVPDELREASYALGVPRWRTITKVVIPTSIGGIAAGITIAVARVIGETAPLLITLGFTVGFNFDATEGRMSTLPVFAYDQFVRRGLPPEAFLDRAWTAALVLILIVMLLNGIGRLVAFLFAPTTGR